MKNEITRRQLLGYGAVIGGTLASGAILGNRMAIASKDKKAWAYHELDPAETEKLGYYGFYEGRCCFGTFKSIIGQLGDKYGAPYKDFPFEMMKYGTAGVAFWGTLCGAMNGTAAAIGLLLSGEDRDKIITSLYAWYEKTEFPIYSPTQPVHECKMPKTSTESVLCHRSVGKWLEASGNAFISKEKLERCARVTADSAKKAVELLNAHLQGTFKEGAISSTASSCLACHGIKKDANALSKMNCTICHVDKLPHAKR